MDETGGGVVKLTHVDDDGYALASREIPEPVEIEIPLMSLRDYFAAAVASTLVDHAGSDWPQREIGVTAYRIADDLLRARTS